MIMQNGPSILVATADPDEVLKLAKALDFLSHPVSTATTGQQILELLRRELFSTAIVGTELRIADRPALFYLAGLPTLELLIGIGPSGDTETEIHARFGGSDVFLTRPIKPKVLVEMQSLIRGPPYDRRDPTRLANRKEVNIEKNNW